MARKNACQKRPNWKEPKFVIEKNMALNNRHL